MVNPLPDKIVYLKLVATSFSHYHIGFFYKQATNFDTRFNWVDLNIWGTIPKITLLSKQYFQF